MLSSQKNPPPHRRRARGSEAGQGAVEYGISIALIALVVIVVLFLTGGKVNNAIGAVTPGLTGASGGGCVTVTATAAPATPVVHGTQITITSNWTCTIDNQFTASVLQQGNPTPLATTVVGTGIIKKVTLTTAGTYVFYTAVTVTGTTADSAFLTYTAT